MSAILFTSALIGVLVLTAHAQPLANATLANATGVLCPDGSVPQGQLSVTGNGLVTSTPDIATVIFDVESTAENATYARQAAAVAANATFTAIQAAGIPSADVSTIDLSLTPKMVVNTLNGTNKIVGYTFSQSIKVQVKNLTSDILSRVIDGAVLSGGNALQISSLTVDLSPALAQQAMAQAKQQAVGSAQSTAMILSQAANVTLGAVTLISDQSAPSPLPRALATTAINAQSGATVPTPVVVGTHDTQASVNMEYALCRHA